MTDLSHIRNFSIIAHIDHGKSTLADRIIQVCGGLADREMAEQVLDSATVLSYRGLARLAAIHARQIDGADDVRATVSSRQVRVDVRGPRADQAELRRAVSESVSSRLAELRLRPLPRVVVRTRHREVN